MGMEEIVGTVTEKFGPLPVWAWGLLAGGAAFAVSRLHKASAALPLGATGGGSVAPADPGGGATAAPSYPPVTYDPGQGVYNPNTGQTAGGSFLNAGDITSILGDVSGSAITNVTYQAGQYGFSANNDDLQAIAAQLAEKERENIVNNTSALGDQWLKDNGQFAQQWLAGQNAVGHNYYTTRDLLALTPHQTPNSTNPQSSGNPVILAPFA